MGAKLSTSPDSHRPQGPTQRSFIPFCSQSHGGSPAHLAIGSLFPVSPRARMGSPAGKRGAPGVSEG